MMVACHWSKPAWQNMTSLLDEDLEAALKGFHLG
jgi:hypothetical protein